MSQKIDVIMGTESWLSPAVAASKISQKSPWRVQTETVSDYLMTRGTRPNKPRLWNNISENQYAGKKTLFIDSKYWPDISMSSMADSLGLAGYSHNSIIILHGDYNFPGTRRDWIKKMLKRGGRCQSSPPLHREIIDESMMTFDLDDLDLILTNQLDLFPRLETSLSSMTILPAMLNYRSIRQGYIKSNELCPTTRRLVGMVN